MIEEKYIDFMALGFNHDSTKISVKTFSREVIIIDNDVIVKDFDAAKILAEYMSSIDTCEMFQTEIYTDYIFSDDKIIIYSRTDEKRSYSLISIDKLVQIRDKIMKKRAPTELLWWIDAVVDKAIQKRDKNLCSSNLIL